MLAKKLEGQQFHFQFEEIIFLYIGKLYCFSFATAFFIYVVVNMGMVLGLLPIVGAPLPIMSYGGSSMLAIMKGLGIAMSCKIYKDAPVN